MAQVDPDDDLIGRYIVWHLRYDPERRQRRNVPIGAYDNPEEMTQRIAAEATALEVRKSEGMAEAVERVHGSHKPPGHAAAMTKQRAPSRPRPKPARVRKATGH